MKQKIHTIILNIINIIALIISIALDMDAKVNIIF